MSDLSAATEAELARALRDRRKARKAERAEPTPKLTGQPGEATPRKRLTRAEVGVLLGRQNGRCPVCLAWLEMDIANPTLAPRPMIDEHILPLELGGSNDLSNRALYCVPCARAKTKIDIARISKAKRQAKLLQPRVPSKRPLRSRGFG